eukprot:93057-Prorocentrum_lima.AAC.1
MRLRGGDPEGDAERLELRLAQGLLRLSQIRKAQEKQHSVLNVTEYESSNMEWNDVKVHLGVLRCLDQTLCDVKLCGTATDAFTVQQDLTDQTNLVTRKMLSAETNLDALQAGLHQALPDNSQ